MAEQLYETVKGRICIVPPYLQTLEEFHSLQSDHDSVLGAHHILTLYDSISVLLCTSYKSLYSALNHAVLSCHFFVFASYGSLGSIHPVPCHIIIHYPFCTSLPPTPWIRCFVTCLLDIHTQHHKVPPPVFPLRDQLPPYITRQITRYDAASTSNVRKAGTCLISEHVGTRYA